MAEHQLCNGAIIRLLMMQTHYKKPINFSHQAMSLSKKTLEKWVKACEPCEPPYFATQEVLECYCDDMNTAKAVFFLHKYSKEGRGKDLFKCMKFLGFFGDTVHIHEIKTLPNAPEINFGPECKSID